MAMKEIAARQRFSAMKFVSADCVNANGRE